MGTSIVSAACAVALALPIAATHPTNMLNEIVLIPGTPVPADLPIHAAILPTPIRVPDPNNRRRKGDTKTGPEPRSDTPSRWPRPWYPGHR